MKIHDHSKRRAISSVGKSAPLIRVRSLVRIQDSPEDLSWLFSVNRLWRLTEKASSFLLGGIAQLVERCLCKADVSGSSPLTSTMNWAYMFRPRIRFQRILYVSIRNFDFSSRKKKGLWWIPRHPKTMKGVLTDDTLRRAGMTLWPEDSRIGQPNKLLFEFIEKAETT